MLPFLHPSRSARRSLAFSLVLCSGVFASVLRAAPVTSDEALRIAGAWSTLSTASTHRPAGAPSGVLSQARGYLGETRFYEIDLQPAGYVIVAPDDELEPIVAFSHTDRFVAASGNPLFEMLDQDMHQRLGRLHTAHLGHAAGARTPAAGKWDMLRTVARAPLVLMPRFAAQAARPARPNLPASLSGTMDDVRVAPLLQSEWDQSTSADGSALYNYFTPPNAAGSPRNYYSGCVATMLSQIMRFHQWPRQPVGTVAFTISVGGHSQRRALRGGDGAGGAYAWADMPLTDSGSMSNTQRQAIGALVADAGVASHMEYGASCSAAAISPAVLTQTFHFANAVYSSATLPNLEAAIQANLDAGLPVGLGISGRGLGHAVVVDGYGYNGATLYHHVNMGWSGAKDAWYNLPTIDAGLYDFTTVQGVLFNVDPHTAGEIVSGRITDHTGAGLAGVPVTLKAGTLVITATTNAAGIYAAKGLPANTTFTVTPAGGALNCLPAKLIVTTGHSSNSMTVGDKPRVDFAASGAAGAGTSVASAAAQPVSTTAAADPLAMSQNAVAVLDQPSAGAGAMTFPNIPANIASGAAPQAGTVLGTISGCAGSYEGLIMAAAAPAAGTSGSLKVAVTSTGRFTGRLLLAGLSYSMHGSFNAEGAWAGSARRAGAPDLALTLNLDPAASLLTGVLEAGGTLSVIAAGRDTRTSGVPAGSCLVQLSGSSAAESYGTLNVTLAPSGAASIAGRLADGTPVSTAAHLTSSGALSFYCAAADGESLLGQITFRQSGAGVACTGSYAWLPAAGAEGGAIIGRLSGYSSTQGALATAGR